MKSSTRRVPVTELARRYGRSGDLGRHHFSLLRGVEGIRVHQRLQRNRGESFQAEVSIRTPWVEGEMELFGRVDGVDTTPDGPVVEEIKTCLSEDGPPESDRAAHRLQARLYAWMWWRNTGVCPRIRLRWAHPRPGRPVLEESWEEEAEVLNREVEAVLRRHAEWLEERSRWRALRDDSLRGLELPFDAPRPGQVEMMEAVDQVMETGGRLDVGAPTGIGKTLAVLTPGLRALARGDIDTLVACTHRNAGKTVMEDALRRLTERGARVHALTLVARERVCAHTGTPCDCEVCPLARGFYDRLEEGLRALRAHALWDADTWRRVAEAHALCPFAFMMAAAREADMLVGDINYALDPSARIEFVFGERPGTCGLVIDEAHHLPDRARSMLSAELDPRVLREGMGEAASATRAVTRELRAWQRENLDREGMPTAGAEPPTRLAARCAAACEVLEVSLAETPPGVDDRRREAWRMLRDFHLSVDRRLPSHLAYRDGAVLWHFCRDVAEWLRERFRAVRTVVLFSATLEPMESFRRLTGAEPGDRALCLPSPFDPDRLRIRVDPTIPVVWKARTSALYDRLAARIQAFVAEEPGKSLVFFPSYAFMEEVAKRLPSHDLLTGPLRVQPRGMQERDTEAFLAPFRQNRGAVTGLAVLGGALNEGIDLPGDALTTVVVVSIGLPAICRERDLLRAWFQERDGEGFFYAYSLPGLLRARQAVGRVIRGPEDRGRVLLIDPRYTHPLYRGLRGEG